MTAAARIRALKTLQLGASVGALALLWQIYPGEPVAIVAGVGYAAAAVLATLDVRAGAWAALAFSLSAAVLSSWGVYRYLDNGFDYLSGHFAGRDGFYWPAYLFLLVAVASITVLVLHAASWRWVLRPRSRRLD